MIMLLAEHGTDYAKIARALGSKTVAQCRSYFTNNKKKLGLDKIVQQQNSPSEKRTATASIATSDDESIPSSSPAKRIRKTPVPSSEGTHESDDIVANAAVPPSHVVKRGRKSSLSESATSSPAGKSDPPSPEYSVVNKLKVLCDIFLYFFFFSVYKKTMGRPRRASSIKSRSDLLSWAGLRFFFKGRKFSYSCF